jgi:ribosome recycling factor
MLTEKAKEILGNASDKMMEAVAFLEEDLKTYRVGKANPSILNNVTVDYYGTQTPVMQVASVTTPDARTIAIQPWERNMIPVIEKAIMAANLGFTPQNNGEVIRCPIPPLTEERRKELIKQIRKYGEESKTAIRNIRRDAMEDFKAQKKKSEITEDDQKNAEKDMQKLTDDYVKQIEQLVEKKEKELSEI